MKEDPRLAKLLVQWKELTSQRQLWDSHFQDLRDLVNPEGGDFNRTLVQGQERRNQIFDGTAPWANEQLAAGLAAFMTSPTERWSALSLAEADDFQDYEILEWLEMTSDRIYREYAKPDVNFYPSMHEAYLDLGCIGTTVLYQDWSQKRNELCFKALPLADCWVKENSDGMIDCMFRKTCWTTRQIEQYFYLESDYIPEQLTRDTVGEKVWEVIHAVFPREDRNTRSLSKTNKPFASFWFIENCRAILREGGFDAFPYHVGRWTKKAGEVYGRSPGMTCLPDIKMVNAIEKTQIRSAQKLTDPPLLAPSDGFILPIRTSPGSIIYYDAAAASVDSLKPLETKGRYDVGEDKLEQKRQHILRCFYADWIVRQRKKERQTALEIQDEREEMLQLMAPQTGRLTKELLNPIITTSYRLLAQHGQIPKPPEKLRGKTLQIIYISPAARAQQARKGLGMRRFLQEMIPVAQVDPNVLDVLDLDEYAKHMAMYDDVPRSVIRPPEDVAQMRQQRQAAQQAQMMAEVAQPAAAAMKDVATAQEKGFNLASIL